MSALEMAKIRVRVIDELTLSREDMNGSPVRGLLEQIDDVDLETFESPPPN
jgi:hypothetical protein